MDYQDALGREYLLHEEIGRGALAVVRRATSRLGGPPLAAKLLKPELAGDRRVRELFVREEAVLRDLSHPSIVAVRDLVVERGRLALVMDLVDGTDLRRHLAGRGGRLPAAEVASIGAQVAAALAAAHAQGVVHLDLKPENILVERGPGPATVRITDFGVAALLHDADPAVLGGTPGYIAPEIAGGGPATAAADVFALGVILSELRHEPALDAIATDCRAEDPRARPSARAVALRLREAAAALAGGVPAPAAPPVRPAAEAGLRDTRLRPGVAPRAPAAPAPPPAERPARARRRPLLVLAGVAVAAAVAGVTVNAAAGQDGREAATPAVTTSTAVATGSSVAGPPAPPTENVADRTRATFAGHLADDFGTLAISVRDGVAIAYICDGDRVEAWLKGTAAAGRLTLTGRKGASIKGTFDDRTARGTVTVAGGSATFALKTVRKPSGLYRAAARVRNAEVSGSWIVLPDGSQVGVLVDAGVPGPAPRLDVAARRTTVDGTPVASSAIDADSGEGF